MSKTIEDKTIPETPTISPFIDLGAAILTFTFAIGGCIYNANDTQPASPKQEQRELLRETSHNHYDLVKEPTTYSPFR